MEVLCRRYIGRCRDHMVVGFTTTCSVQSMPITTKVLSLNPAYGGVYSIQHYVIEFVSDLRKVDGFIFGYPGFLHQ